MKKIKITESQKSMLESKAAAKLKEDISYSQSGSKAVSDAYKNAGANKLDGVKIEGVEEPIEVTEVQMYELAPKVLDFIKQLYTNPSKEALDPFWESIDVEWDELIQLLTELELIKSVSGGYRLQKLENVGGPTAVVKIASRLVQKLITDKNAPEPVTDAHNRLDNPEYKAQYDAMSQDTYDKLDNSMRGDTEMNKFTDPITGNDEWKYAPSDVYQNHDDEKEMLNTLGMSVEETDREDPMRKQLSNQLPTEPQRTGKSREELLKIIALKRAEELKRRELEEDGGYPAGAANDPAADYNEVEPPAEPQPTQQVLNLEFYLDEIALFSKDGKLYLYNVDTADEGEYEQEASRTETPLGRDEDGMMDVEYGEWEMNGDIVNTYVNNNLEHLSTGKGLNDYGSGVELVEIDKELAQDLLGLAKYIKDPKAAEQFNSVLSSIGLDEMTSSGGGALGDVPIGKMSASPIAKSNVGSEMKTIVDSEEEQAEPTMGHLRRLLNGGNVTPEEWLAHGNDVNLKQVVDDMRNDSSTGYLAAYLVHMLQLAEKGMVDKFNAVRDRLMGKLAQSKHNMQLEVSSTISVGNYMYDANALGTDDFMTAGNKQNKTMPMVKKGKTNEVVAREGKDAKTDTQWPDGQFVEFDDCVKYNNNKVAQNGGCSTGAVDNVVKTKGSKNSVISDGSIYESIAKETGRAIEEVKSVLSRKNKKSK